MSNASSIDYADKFNQQRIRLSFEKKVTCEGFVSIQFPFFAGMTTVNK